MHSPWWRRLMDRVRSTGWWPIHYRADPERGFGSWWTWRGKHYRYQPPANHKEADNG